MVERTNVVFTDDGQIKEQQTYPPPAEQQNPNPSVEQETNLGWPAQPSSRQAPETPRIIFDEYGNIIDILDPALLDQVTQASKAKIIFDPITGDILAVHDQKLMDKLLANSKGRVIFDETGNIIDIKDVGLLDEIAKAAGNLQPDSLPNLRAAFDEKGEVRRVLDREAMVQAQEWIFAQSFDGTPRYIHYPDGTTLQIMDFSNFDQVHDHAAMLRASINERAAHPEVAHIPIFMPLPEVAQPQMPRPQLPPGSHVTDNLFYHVFGSLTLFLGVIAMWVMVYINRNLVKQKIQEIRKRASLTQFTQNDRLLNADNYDEWPDISNNTAGSMFQRSSSGSQANQKKQEPDDGFSKQ